MSEESAAAEIRQWKSVTDHALKNIFDLKEHPVYQRIVRGDFAGRSAERAARDHQVQKDDLLKWLVGIQTRSNAPPATCMKIGFLNRAEKLKEIERILTQPVIIGDEVVIALASGQARHRRQPDPALHPGPGVCDVDRKIRPRAHLVGDWKRPTTRATGR